jgi:rubrerythrin
MTRSELQSPELDAVEVHGTTRAGFIVRGALAAGAAYGASAVTPFVRDALASSGGNDVDILNFALTLEYLESDFYLHKAKSVGLSGEAKSLAAMFGEQEQAHVRALMTTIKHSGGTPAKRPSFMFPATDQAGFLKLAYMLENVGVSAYNGAAPSITNKEILAAAGSIVQVEARHAAAIGLLIHKPVTPDGPFDLPLSKRKVLAKAGPLISKG